MRRSGPSTKGGTNTRMKTADGRLLSDRLSSLSRENTLRVFVTLWFIIYLTNKTRRHKGEEIFSFLVRRDRRPRTGLGLGRGCWWDLRCHRLAADCSRRRSGRDWRLKGWYKNESGRCSLGRRIHHKRLAQRCIRSSFPKCYIGSCLLSDW